jgi:hypothetical protein
MRRPGLGESATDDVRGRDHTDDPMPPGIDVVRDRRAVRIVLAIFARLCVALVQSICRVIQPQSSTRCAGWRVSV